MLDNPDVVPCRNCPRGHEHSQVLAGSPCLDCSCPGQTPIVRPDPSRLVRANRVMTPALPLPTTADGLLELLHDDERRKMWLSRVWCPDPGEEKPWRSPTGTRSRIYAI